MRSLTFPGTYEDDRGVEPLEWRISPTWPVGWAPQYAVSTVIRGVRVRGGDFDTLLPRVRGEGDGLLRWDRLGLVECVLAGDIPITVESGGVARPVVLRFTLDLRRSSRADPRTGILRLTCVLDGVETTVTDDWFEDGLVALETVLPGGHRIMACLTCEYADHSPTGHGLTGMRCRRDADVAGVRGVTEEVLETYLCTSFRRRLTAA
ncbi:MAG TPA: DUF6304 family protein [Kineosporiaceae bacterium]|nr:DUF6304 family protein [Kineosporiaceae bacterium]